MALVVAPAALACSSDRPQAFAGAPEGAFSTQVHAPDKLWSIATGKVDANGRPIRAACVVCHSLRQPNALPQKPDELRQFHRGLQFDHGNNTCGSCHVVGQQDTLRLADGRLIPMTDALLLCGQCHGPQLRDYKAGAHGGMQGHWDLASGGRVRNHCVDCHDPHVPRVPATVPVLAPVKEPKP